MIASLAARTARGPRSQIVCAQRRAVGRRSGSGTTAFTRPRRWASGAPMVSAIRIISMALARGTARGSRWVPPAPGMIAQRVSVSPNVACSAAIRRSEASASSRPPARACPFTAAMIGFQISRLRVSPPRP